jgi:transcriptional regulator with XRE-family HTH domain
MSIVTLRPLVTLRALRQARALTQAELAAASGISPTTVCLIEAARTAPSPHTRRALAEALQARPDQIMWPVRFAPDKLG